MQLARCLRWAQPKCQQLRHLDSSSAKWMKMPAPQLPLPSHAVPKGAMTRQLAQTSFCRRAAHSIAGNDADLAAVLTSLKEGRLDVSAAADSVRTLLAYEEVDSFAKIDHARAKRTGLPEVVFGQGKTDEQITAIMLSLQRETDIALVTRVGRNTFAHLEAAGVQYLTHYPQARLIALSKNPGPDPRPREIVEGRVVVCSAGTADLPVAEEAAVTAELMGIHQVERLWDVGVAGIQRLLRNRHILQDCDVVIAAAGMEGALPSVCRSKRILHLGFA